MSRAWLLGALPAVFALLAGCGDGKAGNVSAGSGGNTAGMGGGGAVGGGAGADGASAGSGGTATGGGGAGGFDGSGCATLITSGLRHACAVRSDHTLWCWGENRFGEVGEGSFQRRAAPVKVSVLGAAVAQVDAGWSYTCARKTDDTGWCWGRNDSSVLGNNMAGDKPIPVAVANLGPFVAQMSAGVDTTCERHVDATLRCWGANIGDGNFISDAAEVSSGSAICTRRLDGSLWCWGQNKYGEVGDGTDMARRVSIQVTAIGKDAAEVAAGNGFTCARKTDGTLWCWGANFWGNLGDDTTEERHAPVQVAALGTGVARVAAGDSHACAVKTDGTVWCWGSNTFGAVGDGTTTDRHLPVQVTGLTGVTDISAGNHSCALKSDGTVWCWGENTSGALGDGTADGDACNIGADRCRTRPVQVRLPCP